MADSKEPSSRERVYEAVRKQIEAAGGHPVKMGLSRLATEVDLSGKRFTDLVKDLVEAGRLVWVESNSKGTTLALPGAGELAEMPSSEEAEGEAVAAEVAEETTGSMEAASAPVEEAPSATDVNEEPAAEVAAASAAVEETPAAPAAATLAGSLRDQILEYLKGQLDGAEQDVRLSTKMIAEAVGSSTSTVAYHVAQLVQAGHITTQNAGSQGTRFRLGGGIPAPAPVKASGGRKPQSVAAAVLSATTTTAPVKSGGLNFCPYCGQKVGASDWRFCAGCGEKLSK